MRKIPTLAISFVLMAGASLSPAMAAGPRASDSNDWPGMSRPANTPNYDGSYRPDAASNCGLYDTYCYYNGRLSLDNTERNHSEANAPYSRWETTRARCARMSGQKRTATDEERAVTRYPLRS